MANGIKHNKGLKAAYQNIHHFFDLYHLQYARDMLEDIIEGAAYSKVCKTATPDKLLFFIQQAEALCHAAFIIANTKGTSQIAAIPLPARPGGPDIEQYHHYMRPASQSKPWACFPWHLSRDEYHTPCIAVKKFVNCMSKASWYKTIYEMLEHAFGNCTINESLTIYQVLCIRKRLLVLIEAFYLIEVRFLSDKMKA